MPPEVLLFRASWIDSMLKTRIYDFEIALDAGTPSFNIGHIILDHLHDSKCRSFTE